MEVVAAGGSRGPFSRAGSGARIAFVPGLRCVLASWILCGHYLPRGRSPLVDRAVARANAGVSALIYLSGFVTHWAYRDRDVAASRSLALQFYARRFGRVLVTLYLAMGADVTLKVAMTKEAPDLAHLLRCLALVENLQLPLTGQMRWCPIEDVRSGRA